jgi:hypothetical protein
MQSPVLLLNLLGFAPPRFALPIGGATVFQVKQYLDATGYYFSA